MTRVNSLAEVKARLSELVALVGSQHERITVTVHGRPAGDIEHIRPTGLVVATCHPMRV